MSSVEETLKETQELEQKLNGSENDVDAHSSYNSDIEDNGESHMVSSSFAALYKAKPMRNQEKRREDLLQSIKLRRNQTVDEKRGLTELFDEDDQTVDFEMEEHQDETELMDIVPTELMDIVPGWQPRRRRNRSIFSNKLMMSEWFAEIPPNLESNWMVKLCPVGVRSLVVANKKCTIAYHRRGHCKAVFKSDLPGGGPQSLSSSKFTVLDCIFNRETKCYFVLDILAWNCHSLKLSDTDLRFYWLKSKLDETPELQQTTALNRYPFVNIEHFPAELSLIEDKLSHPFVMNDNIIPLDGVLFYHRKNPYVSFKTPLVGWLKPYMIPEMLNVPVHESFMNMKPQSYTTLQNYLDSRSYYKKKSNTTETSIDEGVSEME